MQKGANTHMIYSSRFLEVLVKLIPERERERRTYRYSDMFSKATIGKILALMAIEFEK